MNIEQAGRNYGLTGLPKEARFQEQTMRVRSEQLKSALLLAHSAIELCDNEHWKTLVSFAEKRLENAMDALVDAARTDGRQLEAAGLAGEIEALRAIRDKRSALQREIARMQGELQTLSDRQEEARKLSWFQSKERR